MKHDIKSYLDFLSFCFKKVASCLFEGRACIDDFDVGVTLGTGSFGRVRFAIHRATGKRCAIKMLKKAEVMKYQQVRFNVVVFITVS